MLDFLLILTKIQCCYSSKNAVKSVFQLKPVVRWFYKVHKFQALLFFRAIPTIKYYHT